MTGNKNDGTKEHLIRKYMEFLQELDVLCRRYDVTIDHQDEHGAFLLCAGYSQEEAQAEAIMNPDIYVDGEWRSIKDYLKETKE